MSLQDELENATHNGLLIQLRPEFDGDPLVREVFVTGDVYHVLFPTDGDANALLTPTRAARARMQLGRFITGEPIRCATSSFEKSSECYLSPISPEFTGVWAIRDREDPQVRFIGTFVEKDVFIVTSAPLRSELGDNKDGVWEYYRSDCLEYLNELLPQQQPIYGGNPDDVCSNIFIDEAT